jgi:hypothetical protein
MATRRQKTPSDRQFKPPSTSKKRQGNGEPPVNHPPMSPIANPTLHEIRERAYELYLKRGAAHGQDWNDWFLAERELIELRVRSV